MKPSLQAFLAFIEQLKVKANAQLSAMPPLEQFSANEQLQWAFRGLTGLANDLVQFAENVSSKVGELDTNITAEVKAALLAAGDLIEKAAHESAVTAAANSREQAVRQEVAAAAERQTLLTQRRQQLVTDKILPAIAAERVPDVVLAGTGFLADAALIKGRIEKLLPFNLTAENAPSVVAEIASIGLDEDGVKVFDGRFKLIEASCTATKKPAGSGINPLQIPAGGSTPASAETETPAASPVRRNLL